MKLPTPSYVTSFASPDWAEEDAWDSTSDSETTPYPNSAASASSRHRTASGSGSIGQVLSPGASPRPVLRPAVNTSSSTLASSYTHLQAPSPSSYPPRVDSLPIKNGWTMVGRLKDRSASNLGGEPADAREPGGDGDSDLVVGEPDIEPDHAAGPHRARHEQGVVRDDADEIVNGT